MVYLVLVLFKGKLKSVEQLESIINSYKNSKPNNTNFQNENSAPMLA